MIRARDKVPNETSELDITVPELCEQSTPVIGINPVSNSVPQLPVSGIDDEVEPSLVQENESTPSPFVLRRSKRIRKSVDRLNRSCCDY